MHTTQKRKTKKISDNEVFGDDDTDFEPSQRVWNCTSFVQQYVTSLTFGPRDSKLPTKIRFWNAVSLVK
jgi:hypothetical protein